MKTLYFDCAMGAAGDMLMGALSELHPDRDGFLARLNRALAGRAVVSAAPDSKCGISGTHISVSINGREEGEEPDGHCDAGHHHHHTSISEIFAFLDHAEADSAVIADAKAVYTLLADAESRVHGRPAASKFFVPVPYPAAETLMSGISPKPVLKCFRSAAPVGVQSCPAVLLTCMCRREQRDEMLRCIFANTSTLGVREYVCSRYTLSRREESVETEYGAVHIKNASGWGVSRSKPEYEDVARIARETGRSFHEVASWIMSAQNNAPISR